MSDDGGEYIAALCHLRKGELAPFVYERFFASSNAGAAEIARRWAKSIVGVGANKSWLRVTLDGTGVYTEELGAP